MKLPPDVDKQIRDAFDNLLNHAEVVTKRRSFLYADPDDFTDLKTRFLLLLSFLSVYQNSYLKEIHGQVIDLRPVEVYDFESTHLDLYTDFGKLVGLIKSLKFSYEMGILGSLTEIIAANISDDYLVQAEQLLNQNFPLPAAVLIGAVLEDTSRRLCQRNNPPISLYDADNKPKMLDVLISDLKRTNLFGEPTAAELRGYAAIRNAAAHGASDKFDQKQVKSMLEGVQNFLRKHL